MRGYCLPLSLVGTRKEKKKTKTIKGRRGCKKKRGAFRLLRICSLRREERKGKKKIKAMSLLAHRRKEEKRKKGEEDH